MTTKSHPTGNGRKRLRRGDHVSWRSHGTTVTGRVEREITSQVEAAGRTVDASPEEPQYEVRSSASGRTAVHRPSALRRRKD